MQKGTRRILSFMIALTFMFSSCATHKKIVDDEMTTEIGNSADGESDLGGGDDLSLDSADSSGSSEVAQNADEGGDLSLDEGSGSQANADETSTLEQELNQVAAESVNKPQAVEPNPAPEMAQESSPMDQPVEIAQAAPNQPQPETPPPAIAETPVAPVENPTPAEAVAETPAPVVENPVATTPPAPAVELAQIKNLEFKSNENGGAFLITADQPLTYKTRINSETNQVIIEVENATVPAKLKRPLLTKDMNSSIGSIDIYQKAKSNVARFVLQMRNQAKEPLIQPEGNSIVVLGAPIRDTPAQPTSSTVADSQNGSSSSAAASDSGSVITATGGSIAGTPVGEDIPVNEDLSKLGILNTRDLDEYIANNNKFYGKKISIEANDIDIKYILNLISEESGINLILDADVTGRVSVKLRKVPWDQALVLVLKSARLTYRRQGTVLRILTSQSLLIEDQVAINLKNSREQAEPLIVKNFAINYADIGDLERKIREYLADANQIERESAGQTGRTTSNSITQLGKVVSDSRTGMLIVTATESKLKQVESLIQVLDIQPQQVMVEARVVEAGESFNKTMGTNWGLNRGVAFDGSPRVSTSIGNPWADPQPVNISPALSYSNPQSQSGSFASSLWLGKLGVLGDLDANLRFEESEDKIKILSSPRVTVVSNTEATINQSFKLKIGTTSTVTPTGTTFTDSFSDVGVRLSVTPQISNIGTVRMRLNVSRTGAQPGNTSTNSRDMRTEVIVNRVKQSSSAVFFNLMC